MIDQGNQFETFLTQGLYSPKAYANFSKVIEHDVAELSTLLAAGYQSTATLMKSEDWATPKDKKNPGTTHNASVVDHPCIAIDKDKKLIRGTADDVAHLLYDWTQQDMGLRLALAGKTYEAFIPNEYWVAQFLDQGKVDLCYKYRAIDKATYTYLNLDFEIQGRFVKPDGSELLIAARDYKSPALNTKQNYENYHPLPLGPMGPTLFKLMTQTIPYFWTHAVPDRWGVEGPWQNLFYGPENQWVKGHQKDVFGEDVASVNAGRQLALTGVISKVKVLFPDPNTGETGMSGGDFAAYFGDGFASEIAQRLTNSLYSLYAHLNQLVMAADIQAVLSAGTSKCSKSLVDYNPSTLFALASNQVFVKDDAREKAITEVLASASTNLVKNCSSTNLKGVLLADTIEALKKAMNPEKAQAPTMH